MIQVLITAHNLAAVNTRGVNSISARNTVCIQYAMNKSVTHTVHAQRTFVQEVLHFVEVSVEGSLHQLRAVPAQHSSHTTSHQRSVYSLD